MVKWIGDFNNYQLLYCELLYERTLNHWNYSLMYIHIYILIFIDITLQL